MQGYGEDAVRVKKTQTLLALVITPMLDLPSEVGAHYKAVMSSVENIFHSRFAYTIDV